VLSNFFVSDCLSLAESYADDFNIESDADLTLLSQKLQANVDAVVKWAIQKKLTIAPAKSQVTLFTPRNKQFGERLQISIEGVHVPLNLNPKILGLTFDPMLTFRNHLLDIAAKASQCLNILCAVCGFNWGHNKETLLLTYRALMELVMSYDCAVWFPNSKPTNIQKLQFTQNAAMRLITGCHKAAPVDHLHVETKLMPVADHLAMHCIQFLASCMRSSHPSNELVKLPPGPRRNAQGRHFKETLSSKFGNSVSPYLQGGVIPKANYKKTKGSIHMGTVCASINAAGVNPILGIKPPEVHSSEQTSSRPYRTTLNQLRSNNCNALQNYKHFIKATNSNICPNCHSAPQTTAHFFSCPSFPTTLTFWDLCYKPVKAAEFLSCLPTFGHLPPLLPLLPPLPPPLPESPY
jgi:hypothetical protein